MERIHQEAARERGLLLLEVFRCFGTEWASVLPALEFLLYTTPRADTGLCPRDLDRRWSLATPLEREMLLFSVPEKTAISEVARAEFAGFRALRRLLVERLGAQHRRAAELQNRHRSARAVRVGQRVLVRDPRLTQQGAGKLAWRRPLPPGTVTEVDRSGRKATVRRDDGAVLKSVHVENLVDLPDEVDDWESRLRQDLPAEGAAGEADRDTVESRRSPGQLLSARPAAEPLAVQKARVKGLQAGVHIAYGVEGPKRMRVGRVTEVASMEQTLVVHRFAAHCDQRLRVTWVPLFLDGPGGAVQAGAG